MGGITIPNLQPQRDPWSEFLQSFMMGQQLRQERERYQQQFQSEQEDRKLRQQGLKLQLDALKLEGAEREKQFARQAETDKLGIFNLMSGLPGQEFGFTPQVQQPGLVTELGQPPQAEYAPGPAQTVGLPHPEMEIFGQKLRPPTLDQVLQRTMMQDRMKALVEAEAAGLKETATQRAQAPFKAAEREDTQGFTAEQNRLNRANTLNAARISQEGQTVTVQTRDSRGNPISVVLPKAAAVGKQFPAQLSAGAETALRNANTSITGVADIEAMLVGPNGEDRLPGWVGPVKGRLYAGAETTGIGLDPERSEFAATVSGLNNAVINALAGANVPPAEYERIQKQIPLVTDPPAVFRSKLKATQRNVERLQGIILGNDAKPSDAGSSLAKKAPAEGAVITAPDGSKWKRVGGRMVRQ